MMTVPGTKANTTAIGATSLGSDERWRAVQRILASPVFARSARMRALLSFLMIRILSGMEGAIDEWAIAIEVFRRDASRYDPALDRVAWVQTDRLRERLAQHYALYEPGARWQITIPGGKLVPAIVRDAGDHAARRVTIELRPVRAPITVAGRRARAGRLRERARASWAGPAPRRAHADGRSH